jgi:protein O-GlcNAc transferase
MAKASRTDAHNLQCAIALHQAGDLANAAKRYERILDDHPRDFEALRLLGIIKLQQGAVGEAELLISKSIEYNSRSAEAHYFLGRIFLQRKLADKAALCLKNCIDIDPRHEAALVMLGCMAGEAGRQEDALEFFKRVLAINPRAAINWHNCAMALIGSGRTEEAIDCFDKALALDPNDAGALVGRGRALHGLKRLNDALASFDFAISLRPSAPEALVGRGMALQDSGRHEEALACYNQVLRTAPTDIGALLNRAITLRSLRRHDESLASLSRVIALQPDCADGFRIRGMTLQQLRRYDEARASLDRAIALKPNDIEALVARGLVLKEQGHLDAAMAWFERLSAAHPDRADVAYQWGLLCHLLGRVDAAIAQFERAVALKPDYMEARLALCMAQLPVLYKDENEIATRRDAYERHLVQLSCEVEQRRAFRDLTDCIGTIQPFLLAYQGRSDRSLQSRYGSIVCRAMNERFPPAPLAGAPAPGERVRIGIVSGFFYSHSNWKIPIRGWLGQLDRRQFQIFGYYTGHRSDAETAKAVELCDRFARGPMSIHRWRQTITDDALHVLIYPEVGMDQTTAQLATQRLAPIQCASWGHPDTSGFPTLDYYLSSALMEPPDGDAHYTERLVRLPNLSIYYEPPDVHPNSANRSALGMRADATVFWCGQSLYKYLPQFDQVFPRIAREAGNCQFVFIGYSHGTDITEQFKRRLAQAFAALGLDAGDYCVFLPRLEQQKFFAAISLSDIFLDSIGWSGCNSTLESLSFDLPVVTMTSALMRGRHSTAILEMMGMKVTVAKSLDEYVSIAVRLAVDAPWRADIKVQTATLKQRVYRDRDCILALEEFLSRVARREWEGQ